MHILARFPGPNGEIRITEERGTGARSYFEGGVEQSRVLPGGEAGVPYIALMAELLSGRRRALVVGCGGGSLATMLHQRASRVTMIDVNPASFALARAFFWLPECITCVEADMRDFARTDKRTYDAIGIDVGGPRFSYARVLSPSAARHVRRRLAQGGRIAINISCETPDDAMPARIAGMFADQGLDVWMFKEDERGRQVNIVILAAAAAEAASGLVRLAGEHWSLARLKS